MISDYFKAMFNLVVGIVNADTIIYAAIIVFFLLALWIVLSLVTSRELKIAQNAKKLGKYIDENGINDENEAEVIALVSKMPKQFIGEYKVWHSMGGVIPGIWFNEQTCVETPLYGGIYNQNRSVMKSVINGFVIIMLILSLALVGNQETALTGLSVAEAFVVPMFAYLLYKIEYYVYTNIRQYYYKLAVENYDELIDIMNEKYEMGEIIIGSSKRKIKDENLPNDNQEEDMNEEVVEIKRGRGRPRKSEEEKNAPLKIENDEDFAKALARAEKLMARLHKPLSDSQKRRTNKELAEIMDKLSQYKKKRNWFY